MSVIATFGSHSALQILKGAKDEGFGTLCICQKGKETPYKSLVLPMKLSLLIPTMIFLNLKMFCKNVMRC